MQSLGYVITFDNLGHGDGGKAALDAWGDGVGRLVKAKICGHLARLLSASPKIKSEERRWLWS